MQVDSYPFQPQEDIVQRTSQHRVALKVLYTAAGTQFIAVLHSGVFEWGFMQAGVVTSSGPSVTQHLHPGYTLVDVSLPMEDSFRLACVK